jgi:deoxyribonuclease-4
MPYFGAHMSIAGGYYKALVTAREHACGAVQIFTKNNNQWAGKPLTAEDIQLFRKNWRGSGLKVALAHTSYLINLASHDQTLWQRSVDAFIIEMERAQALKLDYLVVHPGTPVDGEEKKGLRRVASALDETHKRCPKNQVMILLETTAGQGRSLGHCFEHLAEIMALARNPRRVGVCLDTCHVFAAGYPLASEDSYRATMKAFDRVIGLKHLRAFHVNDSKKPLGSRVDRHDHIGKGHLGLEAFRHLVNDRRFRRHPMILETPKEIDGCDDMDAVNLKQLRDLLRDL